jgi:hypothetical protein
VTHGVPSRSHCLLDAQDAAARAAE